jgi:hypothetical protein
VSVIISVITQSYRRVSGITDVITQNYNSYRRSRIVRSNPSNYELLTIRDS